MKRKMKLILHTLLTNHFLMKSTPKSVFELIPIQNKSTSTSILNPSSAIVIILEEISPQDLLSPRMLVVMRLDYSATTEFSYPSNRLALNFVRPVLA